MLDINTMTMCCDFLLEKTEGDPIENFSVIETLDEQDARKFWTGFGFHCGLTVFDEYKEDHPLTAEVPAYLETLCEEYLSDDDYETYFKKTLQAHKMMIGRIMPELPCCNWSVRRYYVSFGNIVDKYLYPGEQVPGPESF